MEVGSVGKYYCKYRSPEYPGYVVRVGLAWVSGGAFFRKQVLPQGIWPQALWRSKEWYPLWTVLVYPSLHTNREGFGVQGMLALLCRTRYQNLQRCAVVMISAATVRCPLFKAPFSIQTLASYCWWKKSHTTTWDVQNPVNHRIYCLSTGEFAGFLVAINSISRAINFLLSFCLWKMSSFPL